MAGKFYDQEHWLKIAAETRAVAATMTDDDGKRTLLLIAQRYETLAERAKRLTQESKSPKSA